MCRAHWIAVVAVLAACVAASTWALTSVIVTRLDRIADPAIRKYDVHLPGIAIHNGEVSVDVEQPYFVDTGGEEGEVIVIDTSLEDPRDASKYLEGTENGVVLTRNALVVKTAGEYETHSLKDLPDFVLEPSSTSELKARYFPTVVIALGICIAVYYSFSKGSQVLLFALIPLLAAGSRGVDYGDGLKVACFAMIPAVAVSICFLFIAPFLVSVFMYLVVYFVALVAAAVGLARTPEPTSYSSNPINL
jgi:hypothetical protein